jgi:hypothetical protein
MASWCPMGNLDLAPPFRVRAALISPTCAFTQLPIGRRRRRG